MIKVIAIVVSILVLAACDKTPTEAVAMVPAKAKALEKIIGFSDLKYCSPNAAFEKLLDGLLPTGEIGELIEPYKPVFPTDYVSAFGKAKVKKTGYTSTANVELLGIWRGLPVSNLTAWTTEESDYEGFAITFDAPFQETLTVLNNLGFQLPPSGKRTVDEELASYVHLEAKAGKTVLTCGT